MTRFLLAVAIGLLGVRLRAETLSPWRTNEVVALIGGAQLVAAAKAGYLETALTLQHAAARPRFRDLSWEGDTVFTQPRSVNFPNLTNLLERIHATRVVVQFGQMESLQGRAALPEFVAAYTRFLDALGARERPIILLTPVPFLVGGPLGEEATRARNEVLAEYVAAIRESGRQRGLLVVDLFAAFANADQPATGLTSDGVQLTPAGQKRLANAVINAWEGPGRTPNWAACESLRTAIVAKNLTWFRYWRPTNWAFLAGDRADQPSSRDHRDRNVRWFPAEMEEYGPILEAEELKIANLAQETIR